MLRGSELVRALAVTDGGSTRLTGLDFDRLTEETDAPRVGFDADPQTVADGIWSMTCHSVAVSAADRLRHP